MDQVTIRRAVMADLEAVGVLLQDLDDLHRGALPWLLRRVDGPRLTDFLEAYVSKHDHAMFLALAPEGSLAGVLYMFLRQPARASIVAPTVVAEIDTLVVNGAFHRQHIGTRLSGRAQLGERLVNRYRTGGLRVQRACSRFLGFDRLPNVVTSPRLALQSELLRRPVTSVVSRTSIRMVVRHATPEDSRAIATIELGGTELVEIRLRKGLSG